MFRLCFDEPELSNRTLAYCVDAITDCNALEIPVFLDPLPVEKKDGKYAIKRTPTDLIKILGVAAALGDSSRNLWLKIPFCEDYSRVVKSTTLPLLMLGGESKGDPTGTIGEFVAGLKAGNNVRGALVGRNILFPGKDDPLATALAVNRVVHAGVSREEAVDFLMKSRDINMDALTRHIR